jgi:putative membrane protein
MKKVGLAAAALTVVMAAACGGGRDDANRTTPNDTIGTGGEARDTTAAPAETRDQGANRDMQRWVQDMTMHNTAEIELGKLASEHASNAQVKAYGQMMVKDHTMAGSELKQAVSGHIPVQEQMDDKHRELAQKLRGLSGMEFDREYMDAMVDGHQEVKGMLEDRARDANTTRTTTGTSGNDTGAAANRNTTNTSNDQVEVAVNQWAAKTLPKVEQHLQRAEQLRDTVRNSGRRTTENTGTTNRTNRGQ